MNAEASYNGKKLSTTDEISLSNSENNRDISVSITNLNSDADISKIDFYYAWENGKAVKFASGTKSATFKVPSNLVSGRDYSLQIEGVINDNEHNYVGQSNVISLNIHVPVNVNTKVMNGNTTLKQ